MRRFAITHDYLCPFARNGAEVVVRALEAGAPVEPDFRAFSLSQVHLEEVGAVMGFSRERARQVERDALAALRSPEIRARLEDLVAA